MKTVEVNASRRYTVHIGSGLIGKCAELIRAGGVNGKLLLVSDDTVAGLYAKQTLSALRAGGYEVNLQVFAHGEQHKTLETYAGVLTALAQGGYTRTDAVVALGGGVVGDIAGFAAATYMRGIAYVQMPTTLLAGIDSSVGGKTGVDLSDGKNLVGAFHQPSAVIFDTDTMKTLPHDRFWLDGMGEGLKYAVLGGGEIYDILSGGLTDDNFERFVQLSVALKRDIVEADEREGGVRRLLNLGHTLGHALEKQSDYTIPHGAAVADGLKRITRIAVRRGYLQAVEGGKILSLCDRYGVRAYDNVPNEALLEALKLDKKGANGALYVVVPRAIGNCETVRVPFEKLKEFFCGD